MRTLGTVSCLALAVVASAPAAANPCMSDLFGQTFATEGQCNAALARKRNEIRQFYDMRGFDAADMNGWVSDSFDCVPVNGGWIVEYVG